MHHVAVDASVLINFLILERCDLLGRLPKHRFMVLARVHEEVTRSKQREILSQAIAAGFVRPAPSPHPAELLLSVGHERIMGRGEAACLAAAEYRRWLFACDERRRVRRIAVERVGEGRILTTAGILVRAIRSEIITVPEADALKAALERSRFRMDFESFSDCMP
ncbi:hypothetical protein [Candidatus Palauibacter sp.]|uniref:hypothetical protein n=1 Tax=Candidatus Palauibacter sp. TaxID=3101350 RepID=UPI003B02E235